MKIKVNRSDLLDALDAVSPGVSTSTTVPEMQAVKLEVLDQLKLTSQSADCGAEAFVNGDIEQHGACLVPYTRLLAMLQGASEQVVLGFDGKALKIQMGKTIAQIASYDPAAMARQAALGGGAFIAMPGKQLAEALLVSCAAAGNGTKQSWHEGINLRSAPDGTRLFSADGTQFSKVFIPEYGSAEFNLVVPATAFRRIVPQIAASESVSLLCGEGAVEVVCQQATHRLTAMAVKHPDFGEVTSKVDAECVGHCTMNREALAHSLKMASVMTSELEYNVQMSIGSDGFRLQSSLRSAGEYDDVLEHTDWVGDLKPTGINHKTLFSHLQALKCELVRVSYSNDGPAFKVEPVGVDGWSWYSTVIRKLTP